MEMWFSDEHTEDVKLSIRINEQLFSAQSEFQRIDVLDSREFGRILVADGDLMLTEKDEFIYHEMISCDWSSDVCSSDLVCRKYIPEIACSLNDERVEIFHEDGLRFIRSQTDRYDLIIIDSPNPFGPGEGLFTKEFYGNCYNALREDGIMVNQNESPFYTEEAFQCQRMHKRIVETFPICRVYQAHLPSYPSGHWLFGFASKKYHPLEDLNAVAWKLKGIRTRYYEPRLHAGVFALPVYVEELLEDVE